MEATGLAVSKEVGECLYPMEIKRATRLQDEDIRGIQDLMELVKKRTIPFGIVWYRGDRVQTIAPRIAAVPIEYLWH